jgi:hypothetical protein
MPSSRGGATLAEGRGDLERERAKVLRSPDHERRRGGGDDDEGPDVERLPRRCLLRDPDRLSRPRCPPSAPRTGERLRGPPSGLAKTRNGLEEEGGSRRSTPSLPSCLSRSRSRPPPSGVTGRHGLASDGGSGSAAALAPLKTEARKSWKGALSSSSSSPVRSISIVSVFPFPRPVWPPASAPTDGGPPPTKGMGGAGGRGA